MEFTNLDGYQLINPHASDILREHRVLLGVTQKQVAEKANILLPSYQRFESGDRNIMTASFQIACRVIEALEMDITAFFHGDYVLSDPVYMTKEGLRYKKTGRLVNEDVVEETPSDK